jgi:hypothetical protein
MSNSPQTPKQHPDLPKEWFVYIDDEQRGPFSTEDIQQKLSEGVVKEDDYVWSQGIKKWKLMADVDIFAPMLRPQVKTDTAGDPLLFADDFLLEDQDHHSLKNIRVTPEISELDQITHRYQEVKTRKRKRSRSVLKIGISIILLAAALSWYLIRQWNDSRIQETVSTISQIQEISQEENRELRAVVTENFRDFGPSFAIARSITEPENSVFYLAGNLPDGARLEITLEGIPDTLLDRASAFSQTTVLMNHGLARTPPLHLPSGQTFPRGEYQVTVRLSQQQPSHFRVLLDSLHSELAPTKTRQQQKVYFLGGIRDAEYEQHLKKYHDSLQEKAQTELLEINQFVGMLEEQLKETNSEFEASLPKDRTVEKPHITPKWSEFHAEWETLSSKLNQAFDGWTPEWLESTAFYGKLYSLILQASQFVEQTHDHQNSYLKTSSADLQSLELEISKSASLAQSVILSLRAKIQVAQSLPLTANGMPQREK